MGRCISLAIVVVIAATHARAADSGVDTSSAGAFRAWPGVGVGHRIGGGLLLAPQIAFSMPLFEVFEPEVMVGLGMHASATALDVTNRFSFGVRWFMPTSIAGGGAFGLADPVRPFLWTALHHGHTVAGVDVVKNPIGALLTSTAAGVGHLTGLEAGVGVLLAMPIDGRPWPVLIRGGVSWLPALASVADAGHGHADLGLMTVDVAVGLPLSLARGL